MFSFLSGSVVKQLADSGSLMFIKDQEQISPSCWGTALAVSMSALHSVHTVDMRCLTRYNEVFVPVPFHEGVDKCSWESWVSWSVTQSTASLWGLLLVLCEDQACAGAETVLAQLSADPWSCECSCQGRGCTGKLHGVS